MNKKASGRPVYEERIFSVLQSILTGVVTVILLGIFTYQTFFETDLAAGVEWVYLVIGIVMLFITINFSILAIRITTVDLTVSYGVFSYRIPLTKIINCYRDESSVLGYGGFGIRIGSAGGNTRLVYNTPGDPRVVVKLREGRFQEYVFSTRNPDLVIELIRESTGMKPTIPP